MHLRVKDRKLFAELIEIGLKIFKAIKSISDACKRKKSISASPILPELPDAEKLIPPALGPYVSHEVSNEPGVNVLRGLLLGQDP